jgi:hypothetical protein
MTRLVLAVRRWLHTRTAVECEPGPIVPARDVIDNKKWLEEAS